MLSFLPPLSLPCLSSPSLPHLSFPLSTLHLFPPSIPRLCTLSLPRLPSLPLSSAFSLPPSCSTPFSLGWTYIEQKKGGAMLLLQCRWPPFSFHFSFSFPFLPLSSFPSFFFSVGHTQIGRKRGCLSRRDGGVKRISSKLHSNYNFRKLKYCLISKFLIMYFHIKNGYILVFKSCLGGLRREKMSVKVGDIGNVVRFLITFSLISLILFRCLSWDGRLWWYRLFPLMWESRGEIKEGCS